MFEHFKKTMQENFAHLLLQSNNTLHVVKPSGNKWTARIYLNGKSKHLGTYDTEQLAISAYKIALNDKLKRLT